jgi:arginine repressor
MTSALELRENAKSQLLQIKDLETGVTYLSKVKAIETWAKAEKKDAELQNIIAEQKLRTQRILGQLIKDGQEAGEIRRQNSGVSTARELTEIGVNKKQSSNFQAIAEIPEETFEEFIQEKKEGVKKAVAELTTAGAVRLAKTIKEKRSDLKTTMDINARLDMERELRDLATELKKKYDRDQIELLIKFLNK